MSTGESDYAKRVVELSMQLANSRADVENLRMRIKAVDKEHEQLKKDRADMADRIDAALRRAKGEGMEELEQKYRKELWLNHGHHGLYGDDGEMQCIECHPYGATDYKRDPLDKVEHATFRARMARAAQIENER